MKMKRILGISLLVILNINLIPLPAQTKELTLEECINYAQTKSPNAKIAKDNYKTKMLKYSAFNAGFLPSINLNFNAPGLTRSVVQIPQPDGQTLFRSKSELFSTGNVAITQKLPFTGGEISFMSGINRIDQLTGEKSVTWSVTPYRIYFSQPIFQMNDMRWQQKTEDLRAKAFKNEFIEDMELVAMQASNKFFEVYLAKRNLSNAQLNVSINDTLFRLSKGRFNVGKIAENDVLQSELELMNAQTSYAEAQIQFDKASEDLKIFLGTDQNTDFEIIPPVAVPIFEIDKAKALANAIESSSQFNNLKLEKLSAEREIASAESANSFNARITAGFGANQSSATVPDAMKNLLRQEEFSVGISIPLFQWGKGSDEIEAAYTNKDRSDRELEIKRRTIELDLKYETAKFENLMKQVELSSRADTIAGRRFEVAKNRYLIGTIDLTTFFNAQREKDSAFASYISTLRNFWYSYYNLRKLTLFDFQNKKKIEYETAG